MSKLVEAPIPLLSKRVKGEEKLKSEGSGAWIHDEKRDLSNAAVLLPPEQVMNIIVNDTGTEHWVGEITEDDRIEEAIYYAWSYCGRHVEGRLYTTKTMPTDRPCKACFGKERT